MKLKARNVGLVLLREVREIVGTKGFVFMLLLPLIMLMFMGLLIPLVERLQHRAQEIRTTPVKIGVIGMEADLLENWRTALTEKKLSNGLNLFELTPLSTFSLPESVVIEGAQKNVREKQLDAYVQAKGDLTGQGQCDFYSMRGLEMQLPGQLSSALAKVVRNERLKADGLDPERINLLTRWIGWNEYELPAAPVQTENGQGIRRADFSRVFAPAMIAIMMMFFLTFATSQRLLRGIVEEKASRVVEVILSSVSPSELMTGKVFGFYLIGLIQFAVWVGIGLALAKMRGIQVAEYVPPSYFWQFLLFLTTGYLFYASVFAAIGAIVGDETESQQVQGLITLVIVLPLMFNFVLITQPNWWPVRVLSFIPFFTPTVMAVRMVVTTIPWWEMLGVSLVTVASAIMGIGLAARIFRIGILMTGKRPSYRELVKWCFYEEPSGVREI